MELNKLTIEEIHKGLVEKKFSAREVAESFLSAIKEKNKSLNAYLAVFKDEALAQAEEVDKKIQNGEKISLLAGVPMALKDNILLKDRICTAGSKILENYLASYDADVVRKLKEQDAVILGKLNMDEFAMGSSGEYSSFGPTKNPLDLSKVPGGSSSGPAAAVASGMCCYALGSDTGGSIRQPASFCGIVGFKPTYGAVSRYGLIALASSLDQIGPLARTVADAEIVFNAIAGKTDFDSTSSDGEQTEKFLEIKKLKIGLPREYFVEGLEAQVREAVEKAVEKFRAAGAEIAEISLPRTEYGLACYQIILPAECSSNLARYDGLRYGFTAENTDDLLDTYLASRHAGFGNEVKRRIILGTYALSAGYYQAYYAQAQKVRDLIRRDFEKAFQNVDFILTPTSPTLPFNLGERENNPLAMYLADLYTASANLAGVPAISIPCYNAGNLSVGLQIIGRPFKERELFAVAKIFEKIK